MRSLQFPPTKDILTPQFLINHNKLKGDTPTQGCAYISTGANLFTSRTMEARQSYRERGIKQHIIVLLPRTPPYIASTARPVTSGETTEPLELEGWVEGDAAAWR
eukprot:CAMPEP_0195509044 /NCGR_PEP_ID=MMETSP0794_2-20130614/2085_1 /TAXON_ID=515487 /ORGANISM="Stephanopyxis turris, Strain CCMP 815" /LENGTH=104 /DNA_ID=CAMNT_0040636159 /DNA_START=258 /DNA_END=572 /DNA_ORIENTATION=-